MLDRMRHKSRIAPQHLQKIQNLLNSQNLQNLQALQNLQSLQNLQNLRNQQKLTKITQPTQPSKPSQPSNLRILQIHPNLQILQILRNLEDQDQDQDHYYSKPERLLSGLPSAPASQETRGLIWSVASPNNEWRHTALHNPLGRISSWVPVGIQQNMSSSERHVSLHCARLIRTLLHVVFVKKTSSITLAHVFLGLPTARRPCCGIQSSTRCDHRLSVLRATWPAHQNCYLRCAVTQSSSFHLSR